LAVLAIAELPLVVTADQVVALEVAVLRRLELALPMKVLTVEVRVALAETTLATLEPAVVAVLVKSVTPMDKLLVGTV
jgi:hypothetical protein